MSEEKDLSQIEAELEAAKTKVETLESELEAITLDIDNSKLNDWKEFLDSLNLPRNTIIPETEYQKFADMREEMYYELALAEMKTRIRNFKRDKVMNPANIKVLIEFEETKEKLEDKLK